jgi:cbb3-type cytochrome oxidase cytochrome c subunit
MLVAPPKGVGIGIVTFSILALLTSGCIESRADRRQSRADEELARRVILSGNCGSCHSLQARGFDLTGRVGPDLTRQGRRGRSPDWLRRQITRPTSIPDHEVVPGFEGKQKFMPVVDLASDRELNALVEFLRSLN